MNWFGTVLSFTIIFVIGFVPMIALIVVAYRKIREERNSRRVA